MAWYNYTLTTNILCVVSEFVEFGDLHTFWQAKKKFDENTVRLLGAEIALALGMVPAILVTRYTSNYWYHLKCDASIFTDYFHANGIIYRDLKVTERCSKITPCKNILVHNLVRTYYILKLLPHMTAYIIVLYRWKIF
jgi:serine/threonine protein kinase